MTRPLLPLLLAALVLAPISHAEVPAGYTRFLVPLYAPPTPGAYGSQWEVSTWLRYSGTEPARMVPRPFCYGIECPLDGSVEPNWPSVPLQHLAGFPWPALVVYVDTAHASGFHFGSRIRDVSRASHSAGTQVPVVPEDRMMTGPLALLNVPVEAPFRHMLRVYALPGVPDPEVEVRYFRQPDPNGPRLDLEPRLLRADRVRLRTRETSLELNLYPAIAEVGGIETFAEVLGEETIWIEVVPVTPELRIWALLSITNNETQQVTVISP